MKPKLYLLSGSANILKSLSLLACLFHPWSDLYEIVNWVTTFLTWSIRFITCSSRISAQRFITCNEFLSSKIITGLEGKLYTKWTNLLAGSGNFLLKKTFNPNFLPLTECGLIQSFAEENPFHILQDLMV